MSIYDPTLNLVARAWRNSALGYGGGLVFTRATSATYVNPIGVLKTAASGALRHWHDPTTRKYLGWMIEGSRQNVILQSEVFGTTWTASGGQTLTSNSDTAPDGAVTADQIEWTTTADTRRQNVTIANDSAIYTSSLFLKKGKARYVGQQLAMSGGSSIDRYAIIDTQAGSIVNFNSLSDAVRLREFADYYRASITEGNNGSGNTSLRSALFINNSAASLSQTTGIAVPWGAQVEAGAFPSSYIPTTTGAVTRNADALTYPLAMGSDWDAARGCVQAMFCIPVIGAGEHVVWCADDATANERLRLVVDNGTLKFQIVDGGSTVANLSLGSVSENVMHTACVGWGSNFATGSLDGALCPSADSSVTLPSVTTLRLGQDSAGNHLFGCIAALLYRPFQPTESEMMSLALDSAA